MKAAPVVIGFKNYKDIEPLLIHTGQHYDENLSQIFFDDLKLPKPHFYLGVGSGSHSEQSAKIMLKFEKIFSKQNPHLVVVVGDVNSTLACALATAKYRCMNKQYRPFIAHIEAGLRSFERAESSHALRRLQLQEKNYAVLTMHRPTNVDERKNLKEILKGLREISKSIPIVFPIHPRTKKLFAKHRFNIDFLKVTPPLGYLDFSKLMIDAEFVLTDSGGIQEETTVLNIPCLTLRESTERPITVSQGTNIIVGINSKRIVKEARKILNGKRKEGRTPKFWDGRAAKRICKIIYNFLRTHY